MEFMRAKCIYYYYYYYYYLAYTDKTWIWFRDSCKSQPDCRTIADQLYECISWQFRVGSVHQFPEMVYHGIQQGKCLYNNPSFWFKHLYLHFHLHSNIQMSRDMIFPTMWYVRPAKPQISLRIRAVWSEPLLVAWIFYECYATDWTSFGVWNPKRRLHRPVWVYNCQNATLLEITYRGSNIHFSFWVGVMGHERCCSFH